MNFHKVFDLICSDLSEEAKAEVLKTYSLVISEEVIEEENDMTKTMVDYLEFLISSSVSEENLSSLIEDTFGGLSEEAIDEITESFIRRKAIEAINEVSMDYVQRKAQNAIQQRKEESNLGKPNIIQRMMGKTSTALGRERARTGANVRSQARLEHAKKVAGSIDKLRTAAQKSAEARRREEAHHAETAKTAEAKRNKVFAANAKRAEAEAGLRAEHAEKIASGEARYRSPEAKKAEVKERRKKEAAQAHREEAQKKAGQHLESGAPISMDNAGIKRTKVNAEVNKKVLDKTGSKEAIPMGTAKSEETEAPKVKKSSSKTTKTKTTKAKTTKTKTTKTKEVETPKTEKVTKVKAEKTETPKAKKITKKTNEVKTEEVKTPKAKKTTKASSDGLTPLERREIEKERANKAKALQGLRGNLSSLTSKPGYSSEEADGLRARISKLEKELAHECLTEFIVDLAKSNISESSFVEIVEMISNKKVAEKAIEAKEKDILRMADSVNHDLQIKGNTDPAKVENMNNASGKLEKFRDWVNKRYPKES